MRKYPEHTNKITQEECLKITKKHRSLVIKAMHKLFGIAENLGKEHDKDKENPKKLELYTDLLNNPGDENIHKERKEAHNYDNPHHVEGFMICDKPNIQFLIEMVCDNVATAIARNAKYENIFEQNKERYMQKGLPENLAVICTNTFVDIRNSFQHSPKESLTVLATIKSQIKKIFLTANQLLSKTIQKAIK